MSQTPLRLETYFFPKVQIEANPDYSPTDVPEERDVQMKMNVGLLGSEQEPNRFQLMLDIEKISVPTGILPYRLSLEAVAFLTVDDNLKHSDIKRLVQVNGASMLYSAVRELVLMVTGRGPWGAFQLPTVNFHGVIPLSGKSKETESKEIPSQRIAPMHK
jgi:preprotein translocase subunit SecB